MISIAEQFHRALKSGEPLMILQAVSAARTIEAYMNPVAMQALGMLEEAALATLDGAKSSPEWEQRVQEMSAALTAENQRTAP